MASKRLPMCGASRRAFLQRAGALAAAGSAAPWALNLAALGEAAAATASDYKALVCVFLYGGNDHANTLVPYDSASYTAYSGMRPTLAYARDDLAATVLRPTLALPDARQYALAPPLAPLLPLFDAGRLGVLLNVGTLVGPTTKAQYAAGSGLPPTLFSHNDQQSVWQSSSPEGATSGWGGRIGDLLASGNGNATFTCMNVAGNAVFLSGRSVVQYQVGPAGPLPLNPAQGTLFGSAQCAAALRALVTAPQTELFASEYGRVMARALDAGDQLRAALGTTPSLPGADSNPLAAQLQLVARTIANAQAIGARRQVFFVAQGGFDNHSNLADAHPPLLAAVSQALQAFHSATLDLGVDTQVTTFTASDFGRTTTATDGSDHGWGGMHFVLGGAVQGGRFYGAAPVVANGGPDDVGQGRLLPSTSVDQYAATLGRWFGLDDAQLLDVLPNLRNWDAAVRTLGFV